MGYVLLIILYGWKSPIQEGGGVWFFTNKLALEEWSCFLPGLPEWRGAALLDPSFQQVCSPRWPPESRACHTSGRARDPVTPWPTSLSSSLRKWRPGRTLWKPSPALSSLHPCCVYSYPLSLPFHSFLCLSLLRPFISISTFCCYFSKLELNLMTKNWQIHNGNE